MVSDNLDFFHLNFNITDITFIISVQTYCYYTGSSSFFLSFYSAYLISTSFNYQHRPV